MKRATFLVTTTNRPHLLAQALAHLVPAPLDGWETDVCIVGRPDDPGIIAAQEAQPLLEATVGRFWTVGADTDVVTQKINAALPLLDCDLVLLADDDDLQSPGRLARAVESYDAGAHWSGESMILFVDFATGAVARWDGDARMAGTTLNYRRDFLRNLGDRWPEVPSGKEGHMLRMIEHCCPAHKFTNIMLFDEAEATVCIQHDANMHRRPFPGPGDYCAVGGSIVTGLGHWHQAPMNTEARESLRALGAHGSREIQRTPGT